MEPSSKFCLLSTAMVYNSNVAVIYSKILQSYIYLLQGLMSWLNSNLAAVMKCIKDETKNRNETKTVIGQCNKEDDWLVGCKSKSDWLLPVHWGVGSWACGAVTFTVCKKQTCIDQKKAITNTLTHWGRMTHICVRDITIIGSNNGLSPERRQAIIWTKAVLLLTGPLGTNFSQIVIKIQMFSFKDMQLKMSSEKCWLQSRPQCVNETGTKWLSFCRQHTVKPLV